MTGKKGEVKNANKKVAAKKPAAKKTGTKGTTIKKSDGVAKESRKIVSKKVETKEPELKIEAETEAQTEEKEGKRRREKKDHRAFWAALITFFITSLLFGMAFFVFMNLEVIDEGGTVKIDHGRIYVDNIKNKCSDDVILGEDSTARADEGDESDILSKENDGLVDNPNPRVDIKNAQLVEVGDFEFYLPTKFKAARGNGNGKYTFNLMNDDGWADVKVYAEKSTIDVASYISKRDSLLELTNSAYRSNGTNWVEMKNKTNVAYGTRVGDTIYAVFLNIKLESDVTDEAGQMISKTIRLKRVYK